MYLATMHRWAKPPNYQDCHWNKQCWGAYDANWPPDVRYSQVHAWVIRQEYIQSHGHRSLHQAEPHSCCTFRAWNTCRSLEQSTQIFIYLFIWFVFYTVLKNISLISEAGVIVGGGQADSAQGKPPQNNAGEKTQWKKMDAAYSCHGGLPPGSCQNSTWHLLSKSYMVKTYEKRFPPRV